MPDAPPALRVYPQLWQQSRQRYPDDRQWPDQFKLLCELARDWRKNNRAAYRALPDGERCALAAFAEVDVADFIATLKHDFPGEANPLLRIDPSDPFVDKAQYPEIYGMNGHKFDA